MEIYLLGPAAGDDRRAAGRPRRARVPSRRHAASDPRVAEWEALMKSMQEPAAGRRAGRMVGGHAAGLPPYHERRPGLTCTAGVAAPVAAAADRHHRRRRHRPHRAPAGLPPARLSGRRRLRRRPGQRARDRARRSASTRSFRRSTMPSRRSRGVVFDLAVPGDQIVGILEQLPRGRRRC